MLYKLNKRTLTPLTQKPFNAEKELQLLIEENIGRLLGLRLVKSEFTIKDRIIDTLAYDTLRRAFVIIEYKKERNPGVFDQGMTYLGLVLENRGELVNEYNESTGTRGSIRRSEVKWNRTKVIFISPEFTPNQLRAAESWQMLSPSGEQKLELWQAGLFANGILDMRQATKYTPAETRPVITDDGQRLHGKPDWTRKLYEGMKKAILGLDKNIMIKYKRLETGFVYAGRIFADISVNTSYLRMWLNMKKGALRDPRKLTRDVSKIRHWGSGDYELKIRDLKDKDYITGLVKQSMLKVN